MSFPRHGYPLGALFVLVTLCAVLLGGIAPLVQMAESNSTETYQVLAAMAIGGMCGILTGLVLGLLQYRMGLGVVLGTGMGAILGMAAGLMALLSNQQFFPAALAMTAGSALVVGVAFLMRRTT